MSLTTKGGFSDSFWTSDYTKGVNVLFTKLQQGVKENEQLLTIVRLRAEAEDACAEKLFQVRTETQKISGGFETDDGASAKNAYEAIRDAFEDDARFHTQTADRLRALILDPYGKWCEEHALRVNAAQSFLQDQIKAHDKQLEATMKLRSQYFNKCRQLEDLEEEEKINGGADAGPSSPTSVPIVRVEGKAEADSSEDNPVEIGGRELSQQEIKTLLTAMLESIPRREHKVAILGTYRDVSTGARITEWIKGDGASLTNARGTSDAEDYGQDLVDAGYLRLVGNIGSAFVNSSRYFYQWKPTAFRITGKQRAAGESEGNAVGAVSEYLAGWNPLSNSDETPGERIRREVAESDNRYRAASSSLDEMRCRLEEHIMQTYKFMENCESDRVNAIKQVVIDCVDAAKSSIPALERLVEQMMVSHEAIQPQRDIRYFLENYRTGRFMPKVQPYENYYSAVGGQTFGIDLEARAKADRKRVPAIVTALLTHIDQRYPDMEGDAARQAIWLVDVPLVQIHRLRSALNDGTAVSGAAVHELLAKADLPVIASTLKLYLLELPDSLVSNHVYEIVRSLYADTLSPEHRIAVLQSTLGTLRLANIATLDALVTHFTRLLELTSADEEYSKLLANALAPCILRPRAHSSLAIADRHPTSLVQDLMAFKGPVFDHLKRAVTQQQEILSRPRAPSTDEAQRGRLIKEQAAAIAARSRASSPAAGPSMTRFPVVTGTTISGGFSSPTTSPTQKPRVKRQSLEVPSVEPVGGLAEGDREDQPEDKAKGKEVDLENRNVEAIRV